MQTRDQELLHYVLFSFNNFHKFITKMEVWCGVANGPQLEPPNQSTVPKPVGRYSSQMGIGLTGNSGGTNSQTHLATEK